MVARIAPPTPRSQSFNWQDLNELKRKDAPDQGLLPTELSPAYWDNYLKLQKISVGTGDIGKFEWKGLQLNDLAKAREWRPGSGGPNGTQANARITASYDAIDDAMRAYLGSPDIANWTSFGKYASREAGSQIARFEAMLSVFQGNKAKALPLLEEFAKHPVMFTELGFKMGMSSSGLEDFKRRAQVMRDALVYGNTQIMLDIGPAFDVFFRAEKAGQNGVEVMKSLGYGKAPLDSQGFLLQAFERYKKARDLGLKLASDPPPPFEQARQIITERRKLVLEANTLMGIEEQMVCLQGPKAFGNPEVAAMIGGLSQDMTLTDSIKTTKLLPNGGNWADFETRMGLKEVPIGTANATMIEDHDGVKRAYLPNPDPKQRKGTILQYFRDNLDSSVGVRMSEGATAPMLEGYSDPKKSATSLLQKAFPLVGNILGTSPGKS